MLFLLHMISKMKPVEKGGSRIGIIFNASPLFTGSPGGGESEIRRWIIENDWLEALVALPEQLFYNTGIATYIWLVTNNKSEQRKGKVQLIDARAMWKPMKKSLGDKRRELSDGHIAEITRIHQEFDQADPNLSKVFSNHHFGFQRITVERPKEGASHDKRGRPVADPDLRDSETVPLPDANYPWVADASGRLANDAHRAEVERYMESDVLPWVPDAWVDHSKTKVGYEIPFTREFYVYVPSRPLEEIDADIEGLESEILALLEEIKR
jgi:type I restriction enzyme M protein